MKLLGMLSMGIFIGLVTTQGITFVSNVDSWKEVSVAVLGSCFGGIVLTFMSKQFQSAGEGLYMYPVGLLLSYTWFQTPKLAAMIVDKVGWSLYLGLAGISGNVLLSIVVSVLILPAAAKDVGLRK